MQLAAGPLINVDVEVNPLMTDAVIAVLLHPERDLFRTPILPDLFFDPGPRLGVDMLLFLFAPVHRFAMGLFRSITSFSFVSFQLSTYGRFMSADGARDL